MAEITGEYPLDLGAGFVHSTATSFACAPFELFGVGLVENPLFSGRSLCGFRVGQGGIWCSCCCVDTTMAYNVVYVYVYLCVRWLLYIGIFVNVCVRVCASVRVCLHVCVYVYVWYACSYVYACVEYVKLHVHVLYIILRYCLCMCM